jgi:hypothetical protein
MCGDRRLTMWLLTGKVVFSFFLLKQKVGRVLGTEGFPCTWLIMKDVTGSDRRGCMLAVHYRLWYRLLNEELPHRPQMAKDVVSE